jgi:4-amino-4-deoxy-L-arabinose transferase-like glycosyltransferase
MKKPSVRTIIVTSWRVLATAAIVSLGVSLLLFSRLETLFSGYSSAEVLTAQSAHSIHAIVDNPINAPYKLSVYFVSTIINDLLLATRIVSAVFGTISIILFYYIIRRVHCGRVAFLATLTFACSAWFLHIARYGTPDIMLPFAVLVFAVSGYWLIRDSSRSTISIAAIIALGLGIYVPGMLWFVLAGLIIRRNKDISVVFQDVPKPQLVGLGIFLTGFVVAPLIWALSQQPQIGLVMLGLPQQLPDIQTFLHNLITIPTSLFAYTHKNPAEWLANLPLLDISSSVLFALGIYYYFKFRALDRTRLLAIFLFVASILVALDAGVRMAILLPAIYVGIAGGVALLISQWFTVFPKNPLAKTVGVSFIALIVSVSVLYNLRAYFIAWPNWQPAKIVFTKTDADLVQ